MSQEKNLRSQIREYVRSIVKEDNFISRYLRNLADRMEKREFERILNKSPELKKKLKKMVRDKQVDDKAMNLALKAIKAGRK